MLGLSQTELGRRAGGLSQDYISKLENGIIDTPQRGTMNALADALGVPVATLYRAAGMMEGVEDLPDPAPIQLHMDDTDQVFDVGQIVAYVEARPGDEFKRRLARQKLRRTPEAYVRLCVRLFRAWSSNSDLAMDAVEMVEN